MLHVQSLTDLGLVHVCAGEPFRFEELEENARTLVERATPDVEDLQRPTLFDFRRVALIRQDSAALSRVIARRQALVYPQPNNFCAFVVRNQDDYGMIRMYCALAAARGLRDIDRSHISTDLTEAAAWLLERTGQDSVPPEHLVARLRSGPAGALRSANG